MVIGRAVIVDLATWRPAGPPRSSRHASPAGCPPRKVILAGQIATLAAGVVMLAGAVWFGTPLLLAKVCFFVLMVAQGLIGPNGGALASAEVPVLTPRLYSLGLLTSSLLVITVHVDRLGTPMDRRTVVVPVSNCP